MSVFLDVPEEAWIFANALAFALRDRFLLRSTAVVVLEVTGSKLIARSGSLSPSLAGLRPVERDRFPGVRSCQ